VRLPEHNPAPARLTGMDAEGTVNEFFKRIFGGDFAGAAELVADDLEYDNVPISKVYGREAFVAALEGFAKGVGDMEVETHRQTVTGNVVMNERTDKFRIGNAWATLPIVGVLELDGDGRIALYREYFDLATFEQGMAAITKGSSDTP
jgi:limonene-1,2-epoxide hydrolase